MMFATPVRTRAWSSTTRTRRLGGGGHRGLRGHHDGSPAATDALGQELGDRERRRLPGEDDFGAGTRRGHDGQRGADAIGALLHARHAEAASRGVPWRCRARRRRPTAGSRSSGRLRRGSLMRRARAWRTAFGQRFLRDAENLAIGAARERRQVGDRSARSGRRCRAARARPCRSSAAATSSTCSCGRSAQTERRASTMCVRARSTAVSMLRATAGGSARRGALRPLQLHQDGGEALRQRVVDVAGEAVALLEHGLPARLGPALFGELALMQRQRRLPRHRVEQRAVPGAIAERHAAATTARTIRGCASAGRAARRAPSRCRSRR